MVRSPEKRLLIWLRKPTVYPYFLAAVLSVSVLFQSIADPFGLVSATNRISAQLFSTALAPFYGRSDHQGQSNIVVVLYDQRYFDLNRSEWPIHPDDHFRLIKRIAEGNPAAVFLDVYFEAQNEARENALAEFYQDLRHVDCAVGREAGECLKEKRVPVFLASLLRDANPAVIPTDKQQVTEPPRVTLAEVNTEEHLYRLMECVGSEDAGCTARTAAAFDLYREWCKRQGKASACRRIELKDTAQTMYLQWGYAPNDEMRNFVEMTNPGTECQKQGVGLAPYVDSIEMVFQAALGRFKQNPAPCPYHTYIGAGYVQRMDDAELMKEFANKVVLIGAEGYPVTDRIRSHVHGYLAGVFWHATALDNLIERGNRFLRKAEQRVGHYFESIAAFILLFVMARFMHKNVRSRIVAEGHYSTRLVQKFQKEMDSGGATLTKAHVSDLREPRLSDRQLRVMTLMQLSSGATLIALLSTLLCLIWIALDYAPENWVGVALLLLILGTGHASAVVRLGAIAADALINRIVGVSSALKMERYFTSDFRSLVRPVGVIFKLVVFFGVAGTVSLFILVLGMMIFFAPIFYFSVEVRAAIEYIMFGFFYLAIIVACVFFWLTNVTKLRSSALLNENERKS